MSTHNYPAKEMPTFDYVKSYNAADLDGFHSTMKWSAHNNPEKGRPKGLLEFPSADPLTEEGLFAFRCALPALRVKTIWRKWMESSFPNCNYERRLLLHEPPTDPEYPDASDGTDRVFGKYPVAVMEKSYQASERVCKDSGMEISEELSNAFAKSEEANQRSKMLYVVNETSPELLEAFAQGERNQKNATKERVKMTAEEEALDDALLEKGEKEDEGEWPNSGLLDEYLLGEGAGNKEEEEEEEEEERRFTAEEKGKGREIVEEPKEDIEIPKKDEQWKLKEAWWKSKTLQDEEENPRKDNRKDDADSVHPISQSHPNVIPPSPFPTTQGVLNKRPFLEPSNPFFPNLYKTAKAQGTQGKET